MKRAKILGIVARASLLAFLGWLYGGDVWRWVQAQSAEVTALAELPRLWLGLLGCAVTLGGAAVLVMSGQKPAHWKPSRLFTIAALSLLFLDFVVLNSRRSPLSSEEQTLLAVQSFAEQASRASAVEAVPRDPALLISFLEGLGTVPFFVDGDRVSSWKLEMRERCAGPAVDPGQAAVGTVIYCVASNRQHAWVTLVGLPIGQVFGARGMVATKDGWVGEVHVAQPESELEGEPSEHPVWGGPTQVEP